MNAEIISAGTELLLGHIANTNAASLARKFAEAGIDLYFVTTVGDNHERLAASLKKALLRCDIVITTGGLGPTVDDITIATIDNIFGLGLTRGRVSQGVKWITNRVGTAPGLIIERDDKVIICLPGPPRELEPMFDNDIIPYLKKRFKGLWSLRSRMIKITGLGESKIDNKVKDLLRLAPPTTVGIYAKLGEVDLNIVSKAKSAKAAGMAIKKIEKKIISRLKPYIFGFDSDTLEGAVANILTKRKKTIAAAESCTGGLLSSRLTDISGSSRYFLMSVIAYSNHSKECMLGVPEKLIKKLGAVSAPVASRMASGVKALACADIGISITGIAGPSTSSGPVLSLSKDRPAGGTKAKPAGLVYIALAAGKKTIVREYRFRGSRAEIKFQASQAALDLIRKNI